MGHSSGQLLKMDQGALLSLPPPTAQAEKALGLQVPCRTRDRCAN